MEEWRGGGGERERRVREGQCGRMEGRRRRRERRVREGECGRMEGKRGQRGE